jgi:hypothetical protein
MPFVDVIVANCPIPTVVLVWLNMGIVALEVVKTIALPHPGAVPDRQATPTAASVLHAKKIPPKTKMKKEKITNAFILKNVPPLLFFI